jgi:hypothetical protein
MKLPRAERGIWLAARGTLLMLLCLTGTAARGADINPCLLKAAELAPVLGHMPQEGRADHDPFGVPMCVYDMKTENGRRFLLLVHATAWDRKRYEQRVALAEGSGIRKVQPLPGVGDSAFFVEGVAGALAGHRYLELNGLKSAAMRAVQPAEVTSLLKLAVDRLPKG